MIQFNLLPDVKLAFLKAQRIKRVVILISGTIATIMLIVFIFLMLYVDVSQKKQLSDINYKIDIAKGQLKSNSNLDRILTIQNQLQALPALDAQEPVASKLFGYLTQITPANSTISSVSVDFTSDSITLEGNADSLQTINQYVDTIKFTKYTSGLSKNPVASKLAFSSVVLTSFGLQVGKGASYTINFNYDPAIFDITQNASLVVPQITTTRSVLEQPTNLFKKDTTNIVQSPAVGGP